MADFAKYFPLLVANEGGYVFDPHDPGGETWRGIARVFNPRWRGWALVDAHKAAASWPSDCRVYPRNKLATAILRPDLQLAALVLAFYQAQYWDGLRLGQITNQCIASQLCDIGVNSGTGRVGRLAQYVLRSSFDWPGALSGVLDDATVAAINTTPAQAYFEALVAARRSFYQYRAGHTLGMTSDCVRFLQSVHLRPDAAMQRYLPVWLQRISAIPFVA